MIISVAISGVEQAAGIFDLNISKLSEISEVIEILRLHLLEPFTRSRENITDILLETINILIEKDFLDSIDLNIEKLLRDDPDHFFYNLFPDEEVDLTFAFKMETEGEVPLNISRYMDNEGIFFVDLGEEGSNEILNAGLLYSGMA